MNASQRMKAVHWSGYGAPEVMQLMETDKPAPKPNEVLIKIHTSSVSIGDARMRSFDVPFGFWLPTRLAFGMFKPRTKIPGMDFSGVIEAIGEKVSDYSVGQAVVGSSGMKMSTHAEYICLSEKACMAPKPNNLNHQEIVALPFGGLTAIHFLKNKAGLEAGQSVLVNGASGAVGVSAVQLAHHLGAQVTGVCSSANIEMVKSLGADQVIDYNATNVLAQDSRYDVILDTVGNLSLKLCKPILESAGKFIAINADLSTNLASLFQSQLIAGVAGEDRDNLTYLIGLAEQDAIKPVIDRVYPLKDIAEAHRYVDSKRKRGNVILTISE